MLSACGGGSTAVTGKSSGVDGNAWTLLGIPPANATQSVAGNVYTSNQEWVTSLALTSGSPYNFQTVYAVTIPNVQLTDVVECNAQAEVTNNLGYDVQVDRTIAYGTANNSQPNTAQPVTTENVTPDMHHMTLNWTWIDTGSMGNVTYSLELAAASTAATGGAYVTVEQGYGYIRCHLMPN